MKYFLRKGEDFLPVEVNLNADKIDIEYKGKSYKLDLISMKNQTYSILVGNRSIPVVASITGNTVSLEHRHRRFAVDVLDERQKLEIEMFGADLADSGRHDISAPMPGLVLRLEVNEGDRVTKDQPILVMEAMKMENEIRSPVDGVVQLINVSPQQAVEKDDLLLSIE